MKKQNDIDIDLSENINSQASGGPLPQNYISVGQNNINDANIYIKQNVYHALENYSRGDMLHERGSVLLGYYKEEFGRMNIVIFDWIEAKSGLSRETTFTITHEAWEYIYKEKERKYPESEYPNIKILGWHHTHPRFGIFLSGNDEFIQGSFFNQPFQTAYVIDPVNNTRGFFQWNGTKSDMIRGFYVYDTPGKTINLNPPVNNAPQMRHIERNMPRQAAPEKENNTMFYVMTALFVFMTVMCVFLLFQWNRSVNELDNCRKQVLESDYQKPESKISLDDGQVFFVCKDEKIIAEQKDGLHCNNPKHKITMYEISSEGKDSYKVCEHCLSIKDKNFKYCPDCGSELHEVKVKEYKPAEQNPQTVKETEQSGGPLPQDEENIIPNRPNPHKGGNPFNQLKKRPGDTQKNKGQDSGIPKAEPKQNTPKADEAKNNTPAETENNTGE